VLSESWAETPTWRRSRIPNPILTLTTNKNLNFPPNFLNKLHLGIRYHKGVEKCREASLEFAKEFIYLSMFLVSESKFQFYSL
jgi:hypothetical protein